MFLKRRLRRNRMNPILRSHIQETQLTKNDFIYPLFVISGKKMKIEIESMPGMYQYSIDHLIWECENCLQLGLRSFLLFGIPRTKDSEGRSAIEENGIIQETLRELKKRFGKDILLITDLCFCEYTSHGHCGVLKDGTVDNDKTLELLGQQALSHCYAGADVVAPSGMLDGMVKIVRWILDRNHFSHIPILSYAVKYESSYYGPFRSAVKSSPQFGGRQEYQMNPGNKVEAILEAREDFLEGVDILMVKPALAYLDIIKTMKDHFQCPVSAYNVSGEYSMIKCAGQKGYIDEKKVALETLLSIKRAGADIIISYFAKNAVQWLKNG